MALPALPPPGTPARLPPSAYLAGDSCPPGPSESLSPQGRLLVTTTVPSGRTSDWDEISGPVPSSWTSLEDRGAGSVLSGPTSRPALGRRAKCQPVLGKYTLAEEESSTRAGFPVRSGAGANRGALLPKLLGNHLTCESWIKARRM